MKPPFCPLFIFVCVFQDPDQGVRAAEEPFPGDPRCGEGNSGEDHRDFRLQVPAVPAQRDAVGPRQGLPGTSAHLQRPVCFF